MTLPFAVDLREGFSPLTFDREANPNGLPPEIVTVEGFPALRLAVQTGAYPTATAGNPRTADRCEVREPDKILLGSITVHRFSLRIPRDFPCVSHRCVVAQMKGNDGLSPLFALRVTWGKLFADWRLPGVTVEHHDRLPGCVGAWHDYALTFGPDGASLEVDGSLVTRLKADFGPPWRKRYMKLGPYRDKNDDWGGGSASVLVRDIRRQVIA